MPELFDSLNPYQNLVSIEASDSKELLAVIKSIHQPVTIINIVSHGGKLIAFIKGDIRKSTRMKGNRNGRRKRS